MEQAERRALTALERKRLETQRKVLLASVTAEAEELLSSLPSAKDLFGDALASLVGTMVRQPLAVSA